MLKQRTLILVVLGIMFFGIRDVVARSPALSASIQQALAANEQALSPISVKYEERTFEPPWRPQSATSSVTRSELRFEYTCAWQDAKLYELTRFWSPPDANNFREAERSFDGSILYDGTVDKRALIRHHGAIDKIGWFQLDFFRDAGHDYTNIGDQRFNSVVLSEFESGTLLGADDKTFDGKTILLVSVRIDNYYREKANNIDFVQLEQNRRTIGASDASTKRFIEEGKLFRAMSGFLVERFYLDPSVHYALVRWETSGEDGTLISRITNSDFKQISDRNLWLPSKCQMEFWGPYGSSVPPSRGHSITVLDIQTAAIPSQQFILDYRAPGTLIRDETTGQAPKESTIPLTSSDLDRISKSATRAYPDMPDARVPMPVDSDQQQFWVLPVKVGGVVALVATIGWLFWRRRTS